MRLITFSILFLFTLCSCNTKAPKIKLNRSERNQVDSLYKERIPAIDSLITERCESFEKKKYQSIKDSIIQIRLAEIEEFLPE